MLARQKQKKKKISFSWKENDISAIEARGFLF